MTTSTAPPRTTNPHIVALVNAARSGDMDAVGELYRLYYADVYAFIRRDVHCHALAEDLTMDTFVKVMRYVRTFTWSGSFRGWLLTIARNTVLDYCRTACARLEEPVAVIPDTADVADLEDRIVARVIVHEALYQLPDVQRRCLVQRYVHRRTVAQVGMRVGKEVGATRMTLSRALAALRCNPALRTLAGTGATS